MDTMVAPSVNTETKLISLIRQLKKAIKQTPNKWVAQQYAAKMHELKIRLNCIRRLKARPYSMRLPHHFT